MANGKKQKMTAKQLKEREERALERQRLAEEKKKREDFAGHEFCGKINYCRADCARKLREGGAR